MTDTKEERHFNKYTAAKILLSVLLKSTNSSQNYNLNFYLPHPGTRRTHFCFLCNSYFRHKYIPHKLHVSCLDNLHSIHRRIYLHRCMYNWDGFLLIRDIFCIDSFAQHILKHNVTIGFNRLNYRRQLLNILNSPAPSSHIQFGIVPELPIGQVSQ